MKERVLKLTFILLLFLTSETFATDFYWVGNGGSWNDKNHWATASGGSTKHTVLPTSSDNVYFDANSFSLADQTVTITAGAVCRSMDWTGVTNSPTISSFFDDIDIYGSLIIPASVQRDFIGDVHFKATSGSFNIDMDNLPLRDPVNEAIHFEGAATWTLQDGLILYELELLAGTLNTNGKDVNVSQFTTSGTTARTLSLGASHVTCEFWEIESVTGFTLNAGTSTIDVGEEFSFLDDFHGGGLTYYDIAITGPVEITGANSFHTFTFNAGSTAKLEGGVTQTISSLVSNGTVDNPITIQSTVEGTAATFSKSGGGTVTISYASIQDNIATGGTFNANNSADLGNVTGWTIQIVEPTEYSYPNIFGVSKNTITISLSVGDGAKRLVLVRQGGSVNADPVDNVSYTADDLFGFGDEIGTGNFVVYSGSAKRFTVTGLSANTTYYFKVYDYNSSGSAFDYLTTSTGSNSETTLGADAIVMTSDPVSTCSGTYYSSSGPYGYDYNENLTQTLTPSVAGNKIRLSFTDFQMPDNVDKMVIYDGANSSAPVLGTFTSSVGPTTVTALNAEGKLTIKFTSDDFLRNGGWQATVSCITLDDEPTISVSNVTSENTGNSIHLSWSNGNGSKRLISVSKGVAGFIPDDGNSYNANSIFGWGEMVGTSEYVVYDGTGNSVDVTGLDPGADYEFSIYEYNGANTSINYGQAVLYATSTVSLANEPSTNASEIATNSSDHRVDLSWKNGNGEKRIILMWTGNYPYVNDGTDYIANSVYGQGGSPEANAYVVYDGNGTTATVTGLAQNTNYYFRILEYNGSGIMKNYLDPYGATVFATLLGKPDQSATNLITSSPTSSSINLSWTRGDGENIMIVARPLSPIDISMLPDSLDVTDGEISDLGSGTNIPGVGSVVYVGAGTSCIVTKLNPATKYYFSAIEFNSVWGNNGQADLFRTVDAPSVSGTTAAGQDFYWVGGSGKWSDLKHWAKTSGGNTHYTQIPGSADNVFFDANSFTSDGSEVTIDLADISCRSMDWRANTDSVSFKEDSTLMCSSTIHVFGSLYFTSKMNISFHELDFEASTKNNLVQFGSDSVVNGCSYSSIVFNGYEGEWTIENDITSYELKLLNGHVIADNRIVNVSNVYSDKTVVVDLTGALIRCSAWSNESPAVQLIHASVEIVNGGRVTLNGAHFEKIKAAEDNYSLTLSGGGSVDSLELAESTTYLVFEPGYTYTINDIKTKSDADNMLKVEAYNSGEAAIIYKATGKLELNYALIKNNHTAGGAQFIAKNSVALTDVLGWTITNPRIEAPGVNTGYFAVDVERRNYITAGWGSSVGTGILIVMSEAPLKNHPASNVSYTANAVFGSGAQIEEGAYVVHNVNGNIVYYSTTVTGLTPGKKYYLSKFDYNQWNDSIMYQRTPLVTDVVTLRSQDILMSSEAQVTCEAQYTDPDGRGGMPFGQDFVQTISPATAGAKLSFYPELFQMSNSANYMSIYDGNSESAQLLATLSYDTMPSGIVTATNPAGVLTFKLHCEGGGWGGARGFEGKLFCLTSLSAEPTVNVASIEVTQRTETSMSLNFPKGNGTGRIVIAAEYEDEKAVPIDGLTYNANAHYGDGDMITWTSYNSIYKNGFVVYAGSGETVTVTGLRSNTKYTFKAYEYNGSTGNINYLNEAVKVADTTLAVTPTLPPSNLNITYVGIQGASFTYQLDGSDNSIVVVRKGKPVTVAPVDGKYYAPLYTDYWFGNGPDLGDSSYVVHRSPVTAISLNGLQQNTTYYFKVFSFQGDGIRTRYLTSESLTGSFTTLGPKINLSLLMPAVMCPGDEISKFISVEGNLASNANLYLQLSDFTGSFAAPVILNHVPTNMSDITGVMPDNLTPGAGYRLRVVSDHPVVVSDTTDAFTIPDLPKITISFNDGVLTSSLDSEMQWWERNGVTIDGATGPTYEMTNPGSFAVMTYALECEVRSNEIVITGNEQFDFSMTSLYPVPAKDQIEVTTKLQLPVNYTIVDMTGKAVINGTMTERRSNINVAGIAAGIYFLRLQTGKQAFIKKISKQ